MSHDIGFQVGRHENGRWVMHQMDEDGRRFLETVKLHPEIYDRYVSMRIDGGQSHKMAEMLATGKFPSVNTDATFLANHCNGNQFESSPDVGNRLKKIAEEHGVNTTGKVYLRGLARFAGDPEAWVSGKGDVQRVADERGWGVHGAVNVERREVAPTPDIPVADDIVAAAAAGLMHENPGLRPEDARERAFAVRSGQHDADAPRVAPVTGEALAEGPDSW